jgi:hypothetical protein
MYNLIANYMVDDGTQDTIVGRQGSVMLGDACKIHT